MYFVGIDIAKKTHQAAIICSDGKLIGKPFKFSNTIDGFNLFLEKLTAVNTDLSQFEIGMEATGHYWLNLYTWLSDKSFRLHVINPLQSDALRNLYIRKTKTDSVDAKIIADVIRIGQYSETQLADENIIALRDLNRQRFYLVSNVRNSACCRNGHFYSCGGFNTPTLCVVTKGIKTDCNHLMRTTYPDALRRGMLIQF